MKFTNPKTFGVEEALLSMRNVFMSHDKSDSKYIDGKFVIGENDLKLAKTLVKSGTEHRKFIRQIAVTFDILAPAWFFAQLDTYKVGMTRSSSSLMHRKTSQDFAITDFEVDPLVMLFYSKLASEKPENLETKADELTKSMCNNFNITDKAIHEASIKHFGSGRVKNTDMLTFEKEPSDNYIQTSVMLAKTYVYTINALNELLHKFRETSNPKIFEDLRNLIPSSVLYFSTCSCNFEVLLNMYSQRKNHRISYWNTDYVKFLDTVPYFNEICLK